MENVVVLIVGAGPAGLATAACLSQFSIPYVIVERESCSASLWRNHAYNRLKLHLAKEFCELPHMSYPVDAPTYIPKTLFVKYLDDYVERFNIQPKYLTSVESSTYDNDQQCWSIVIHIMTKELIRLGMTLARHLPLNLVDNLIVMAANLKFGDLSKHGIRRPKMGPMILKSKTGRSAVIDVGTVGLIKKGIIKVHGSISKIMGDIVEFQCSKEISFDAIVFATGYKSTTNIWLTNGERMLNENGLPIKEYPNHWKGENGLYCVGLARRGLAGIAADAKNIAGDIKSVICTMSG
uniref:indole-3-pyruvate monooxygenase n=1 Tax=Aegilops tauschii subsp. strangulata TaxID=200361 RepID=A0A453QKT5_AEGTS